MWPRSTARSLKCCCGGALALSYGMGWYTGPIIGGSVPCPSPSPRVGSRVAAQGQDLFAGCRVSRCQLWESCEVCEWASLVCVCACASCPCLKVTDWDLEQSARSLVWKGWKGWKADPGWLSAFGVPCGRSHHSPHSSSR